MAVCLSLVVIGGSLFYVIAKPSFGGYFDCAWDETAKKPVDCRKVFILA
jgi:hypothetical protein